MKKLDSRGIVHLVPLIALMAVFILGGLYYVSKSRAATPQFTAEAENMQVGPAAAIPSRTVLNPSADAWADSLNRTANYGGDQFLQIYNNMAYSSSTGWTGGRRDAAMRFNLTNTPNSVYSAKLRFRIANATVHPIELGEGRSYNTTSNYPAWPWPTPWPEHIVNYNNIGWTGVKIAGIDGSKYPIDSWVEIDVTPWAQAHVGQEMSVTLITTGKYDPAYIYSKESASKPELVLTFGGSTVAHVYGQGDSVASGGKSLKFYTNGTASTTITTTSETDQVSLYGRGDQCQGAPFMTVKVNGIPVYTDSRVGFVYDNSTAFDRNWWGRPYTSNNKIPAGTHRVQISYNNDLQVQGVCDRNAIIDKVVLSKREY